MKNSIYRHGQRVLVTSGIVQSYLQQYGYGFIVPDDGGKNVHFHINQGRKIGLGLDAPMFDFEHLGRSPMRGDRLVFVVSRHSLTASDVWGYEYSYTRAKKVVDGYPVYRIVEQHLFAGENGPRPAHISVAETKLPVLLKWLTQGKVKFRPLDVYHNRRTTQWFERLEDKIWVKCPDDEILNRIEPRVSVTSAA